MADTTGISNLQVAIIAALGGVVTAIATLVGKFIDKKNAEAELKSKDIVQFRTDLINRVNHLENIVTQVQEENIRLVKENSDLALKVDMYRNEIAELKTNLASMSEANTKVLQLTEENKKLKEQIIELEAKITELETKISELESEAKHANE